MAEVQMMDKNYKLSGGCNLAVPLDHADKLVSLGDGAGALLYLYALRQNGSFNAEGAARALGVTAAEIARAAGLLSREGLLDADEKLSAPLPAEELPQYTANEVVSSAQREGEFQIIIDETQHILGKVLTGADINTLFGLYDHLKLPAEVIILLINYCVSLTRENLGPGKLPSMRTIEKEGYAWFNNEILTLDRAEEYLRKKREYRCRESQIKRILQIRDRGLSTSEKKYISSWLDMGFGLEAIEEAYDRTVVKTGKLQWKYMNSILSSWHEKGLHTSDEIEKGDNRPGEPLSAYSAPKEGSRTETDRIREMMDKL